MGKRLFDDLLESVQEMKAIMRGEKEPSRVFRFPNEPRTRGETRFAVCIETDDPELLIPRKIYEVDFFADLRLIALTDEAGEAAVYPADHFVLIDLPTEVKSAFAEHGLVSSSA